MLPADCPHWVISASTHTGPRRSIYPPINSESFWIDQGASGEESFEVADITFQAKTLSPLPGSALYTGSVTISNGGVATLEAPSSQSEETSSNPPR